MVIIGEGIAYAEHTTVYFSKGLHETFGFPVLHVPVSYLIHALAQTLRSDGKNHGYTTNHFFYMEIKLKSKAEMDLGSSPEVRPRSEMGFQYLVVVRRNPHNASLRLCRLWPWNRGTTYYVRR
jgi:hypothetical protein